MIRSASLALKALHELGPQPLVLYSWYRLGLATGYLRWMTKDEKSRTKDECTSLTFRPLLELPEPDALAAILGEQGIQNLLVEADEIVGGEVCLFGGPPVSLQLTLPGPLAHWTEYEKGQGIGEKGADGIRLPESDIKFTWEPGRFGWAYTLGRAYHLSRDERYPEAFWRYTEIFLDANPPNRGPHWASAQEVALRLMAFTFALQVFSRAADTTPSRTARLAQAIAGHAARIPPTLPYARAQNNNHLLTEAAGLYTAGSVLPEHPAAPHWRSLGWRWFNHALQNQIAAGGAYIQQSANYHRLMLQTALWITMLAGRQGQMLPEETQRKLAAATGWLLALLDPDSGRVPNLGPNDGAYILPLTVCAFHDYRAVLQAASAAFLGERVLPAGVWDEMASWLTVEGSTSWPSGADFQDTFPQVLRAPRSWAYLRAAHFTGRPGHADQLHLDLWWRGLNVAQDAGTYLYNAPPPWNNALSGTSVHNTVTVNGRDQMSRAGRFLYLDWAQAQVGTQEQGQAGHVQRLTACHNGYRHLGILHERTVECLNENWLIVDRLQNVERSTINLQRSMFCLHWLLPDWPWEIEGEHEAFIIGASNPGVKIRLHSPYGWIGLRVVVVGQDGILSNRGKAAGQNDILPYAVRLVRAGDLVFGEGSVSKVSGWVSPTYGVKIPALSFQVETECVPPVLLTSEFTFPPGNL